MFVKLLLSGKGHCHVNVNHIAMVGRWAGQTRVLMQDGEWHSVDTSEDKVMAIINDAVNLHAQVMEEYLRLTKLELEA